MNAEANKVGASETPVDVASRDVLNDGGEALPEGWAIGTLGEVGKIIRGVTFPSKDKKVEPTDGHVMCLRTSNVQEDVEWDDVHRSRTICNASVY